MIKIRGGMKAQDLRCLINLGHKGGIVARKGWILDLGDTRHWSDTQERETISIAWCSSYE